MREEEDKAGRGGDEDRRGRKLIKLSKQSKHRMSQRPSQFRDNFMQAASVYSMPQGDLQRGRTSLAGCILANLK